MLKQCSTYPPMPFATKRFQQFQETDHLTLCLNTSMLCLLSELSIQTLKHKNLI